ncbi:MAG: MobF family relaxase [Pseudomonadota bacterium]
MLSIGQVSGAGGASRYFTADNYYSSGEFSPSEWLGQGAEAGGLAGAVEADAFKAVLEGHVPESEQQLGYEKEGIWRHQEGWDLTFSAPKSVSLLSLVGGDLRIRDAHDKAVAATIAHVEARYGETRIREGGEIKTVKTGKLVVAAFKHDLSRDLDPQLHTHAVVANMTQGPDGKWRSINSRPFYQDSKVIGRYYREQLAMQLSQLGYGIETGKDGLFEIKGFSKEIIAEFSQRRAEIERSMAERGLNVDGADARTAQRAALMTRDRKGDVDRVELGRDWEARAGQGGLTHLREMIAHASKHGKAPVLEGARAELADAALRQSIQSLSERETSFTGQKLTEHALKTGMGEMTSDDLAKAIIRAEEKGALIPRQFMAPDLKLGVDRLQDGFTTPAAQALEQKLVGLAKASEGSQRPLAKPRQATRILEKAISASADMGFEWTQGQKTATEALLTSQDGVHAVQGLAGTAKTTTVLATVAAAAADKGYRVTAIAPTASAAKELGRATGSEGITLAAHLAAHGGEAGRGRPLWVVDEASLVSTKDMTALLQRASRAEAKLILVGDTQQLGSVDAGAAFRQLQEAGLPTERLDEIVRQKDAAMKASVEATIRGDAETALNRLEEAGGRVLEHETAEDRYKAMAEVYLGLSHAERRNLVIVEPSRTGRDALTEAIREGLLARGDLGATSVATTILRPAGLSNTEKHDVRACKPDQIVMFYRNYTFGEEKIEKGQGLRVLGETGGQKLRLQTEGGKEIHWNPREKGAGRAEVYDQVRAEFRKGDRLRWTKNDKGRDLVNADLGTVTAVNRNTKEITVSFDKGSVHRIDTKALSGQHITHGLVQTAYGAQGQTAAKVMLHAESHRLNLITQASFYVGLSRAKTDGIVVTNSREKLIAGLKGRAGQKSTALTREELRQEVERRVAEPEGYRFSVRDFLARLGLVRRVDEPKPEGPQKELFRQTQRQSDEGGAEKERERQKAAERELAQSRAKAMGNLSGRDDKPEQSPKLDASKGRGMRR